MKALFILMPDGFRDEEFLVPKKRLEEAGVEVVVAGLRVGEAIGILGARFRPDLLISEVSVDNYEAVVVPGGSGSPKHLWNDQRVLAVVKEAYDQGKVVAGICLSAVVLAKAGVLRRKKATVFATSESLRVLREVGCEYVKKGVVVDRRVVTADGPASAEKFASEIIKLLK